MKLRAFFSAVALIVLIAPINATELAAPEDGVEAAQIEPSRQNAIQDVEAPLLTASADGQEVDTGDQISAALKAKISAIIAFAREEARNTAVGSQILRSRIRVRCSVRQIVAKPKPSLTAAPALMLSERAAGEATAVSTTLEACTIKLLQVRRKETSEPAERNFSIELPSLEGTGR